jgi:predicted Rossmann fold nucleotide-binding protein DprA/Smf involved in DNA uptake
MADVLSEIRESLERRLRELEPLIEEHAQVRKALDALKGAGTRAHRTAETARTRRPTAAKAATPSRARGRPRGSGGRTQQALKLVREQPGITIADMAKHMKIKANYLYRVLPQLEKDGRVKKQGKGYHAADS